MIAVIGDERIVPADFWDVLPGVEKTVPILAPYKLASKEGKDFKTIIHLSNGKKNRRGPHCRYCRSMRH